MSEYDYETEALVLTGKAASFITLGRAELLRQDVEDALRAAHSRGRSEREAEMAAEVERLRAIVAALPRCSPWLSGSGGHRRFGSCPNIATWHDDGQSSTPEYYCDGHIPKTYRDDAGELYDWVRELPYAAAVRALAAPATEEE